MTNIEFSRDHSKILKSFYPGLEFFEKEHIYKVDGEQYPSVSGLLTNFYDEFETEVEGISYAQRRGFKVEDVLSAWRGEGEIASERGTEVHIFGEDYVNHIYFGEGEAPRCGSKQMLGIIDHWNDLPEYLIPVGLELQMYSKRYKICGTSDILLYNLKTGKYRIRDYKTNKDLYSDPYYPPPLLKHLPEVYDLRDNNFGHYTLQLSFYQVLFEDMTGEEIEGREIVWLQEDKPNKKLYQLLETYDLSRELREWLENR